MNYSSIPLAQIVVQSLKKWGIDQIVISPGSRNAPLTISFIEDEYFTNYSIVDERSAAFFALGMAQKTKKPIVLCCTSGSALLNYYPAIVEAFYSEIPLIILSADRPSYGIDIGDGQTIRQEDVFSNHIEKSITLIQDNRNDKHKQLLNKLPELKSRIFPVKELVQVEINKENIKLMDLALKLVHECSRPVHCNLPFEEPLYGLTNELCVPPFSISKTITKSKFPAQRVDEFVDIWNSSKSIMVLIGVLKPNTIENSNIEWLTKQDSVIVLTETTSNIQHANTISSIDQIIAPVEKSDEKISLFNKMKPDLLITIGGMIVSKKVKAFLREYRADGHIHIGNSKAKDTFYLDVKHLNYDINEVINTVKSNVEDSLESFYRKHWLELKNRLDSKKEEYLTGIPFSDFQVFQTLMKAIPSDTNVHLSNSSAIRYAQLFPLDKGQLVFCNRGTSGIDGSTSTAVGSSIHEARPSLLITGDLSFLYDSNALWNNYIKANFRIIVINNGGGGIFRILPGEKDTDKFDTYFETKHTIKSNALCEMYGLDYCSANDLDSLKTELIQFFAPSNQAKLLEIFTPSQVNDKVLLDYFKCLGEALD